MDDVAAENTPLVDGSVAPGSQLARLLAAAERTYPPPAEDTAAPPWSDAQSIQIKAVGGTYNRERRRVMVAGHAYKRVVGGHRDTVVTGDYTTTVAEAAAVAIGPQPRDAADGEEPEEGPPQPSLSAPGRDSLVVDGNASLSGHDRRVSMGGMYNRTWGGGVIAWQGSRGLFAAAGSCG